MPLTRCHSCAQRLVGKPFSVYWAWNHADGARQAQLSKLCDGCFREHVGPLANLDNTAERLTCPGCGIDTEDDYDAVYATAYVPGFGDLTIEAPFCGACAAMRRVWINDHSTPLEDRPRADFGPRTRVSGDEVLRSMGIQPRVR